MIAPIESVSGGETGDLVARVTELFSATGAFSGHSNFEYRAEQQAMATAVIEALTGGTHLVVEAGTGVGKSFAYLAPAILYAVANKKKAIISTQTINLQEQLVEKDLPVLKKVLGVPFNYTLLKGRANYLCTGRLRKAMQISDSLFTTPEVEELRRIHEWSLTTEDGSLSDFDSEPDPRVWEQVCSERGLCTPRRCGYASDLAKGGVCCFFQRARQRIISADVLVLNHTLFFSLLNGVSQDEENGHGVLFKNDFVIFDEAHTVEQVAARHIGLSVSSGQLRFALQRLWNPRTEKGLLTVLHAGKKVARVNDVLKAVDGFFLRLEDACESIARGARSGSEGPDVMDGPGVESAPFNAPRREWTELRIRQPGLVEDDLSHSLQILREEISELILATDDKETGEELMECSRRLAELSSALVTFLGQEADEHVYWVERVGRTGRSLSLNAAPVDVADYLRQRLFGRATSIIMTSATLSVRDGAGARKGAAGGGNAGAKAGGKGGVSQGLEYVAKRVGATTARRLQLGSPFDFQKQMKLYVVSKMPDPREDSHEESLAHWIKHFILETNGKAFVLFTSYKRMQAAAELLAPFFDKCGIQCYVQGAGMPRATMLERFKENVNSVLFGTDSFWQGVDVPGEALSNVIITRLPFAVPDHPLTEARLERIEARGGNSFFEFSLPEAILKFRQGVGRLIRTRSDSGIVVILDNRVLTKRYGQAFLDALPACPVEVV